jgi:inner membrane protein
MASPYGHALAGLTLLNLWLPQFPTEERSRSIYGWAVFGACLPDLDFIPGLLLGQGGRFHHGIIHSIGFAITVSMLLWIGIGLLQKNHNFLKIGGLILCLTFSHLLMDFFTEATKGFPLLWPFTEVPFLSPVLIFPRVERDWGHPQLWNQTWLCFWVETFLLVPLWIASLRCYPNKSLTFPDKPSTLQINN